MARSPSSYDAVVIGAGHNGLVTACYLARAGLHVLVFERPDHRQSRTFQAGPRRTLERGSTRRQLLVERSRPASVRQYLRP